MDIWIFTKELFFVENHEVKVKIIFDNVDIKCD